jgi:hypothetical protein
MILLKIHSKFLSDCLTPHTSSIQRWPIFTEECLQSFHTLNKALVSAPVVQPPDWHLSFETMCDANDYAVGAVLC